MTCLLTHTVQQSLDAYIHPSIGLLLQSRKDMLLGNCPKPFQAQVEQPAHESVTQRL
jgi:hypothetical protein